MNDMDNPNRFNYCGNYFYRPSLFELSIARANEDIKKQASYIQSINNKARNTFVSIVHRIY